MSMLSFSLQQINRWDVALCQSCNRLSRRFTVRCLFLLVSRLGDGLFWYTLMAAMLLLVRRCTSTVLSGLPRRLRTNVGCRASTLT